MARLTPPPAPPERRIIRVALCAAAVERRLVPRVQRRALLQAFDQVGVGNERFSKRDQVGGVGLEHLVRQIEIIAVVGDIGAAKALAQACIVERRDIARAAGRAFDDVDVGQLQRVEPIDDVIEQRLRIAVGDIVGGRHRRDADAGALGAGYRGHHLGHFQHQLGAVLDRSAIGIGALVGAVLGELIEQIAVGAVDLDAVETGGQRILGAALEILDDPRNFRKLQRARLGDIGEGAVDKRLALGADRGRRHRLAAAGLQRIVRDAADMPDLDEDAPAFFMHAVGDLAPACDLLLGIDAGRILIALALLRNLAGFGDQKARGGALAVIVDRQRARHHAGRHRAVAGQRRHHEAVRKRDRAKLEGLEQFGLAHVRDVRDR